MGKIRVKTFGDEEAEQKEQQKKEAKKAAKKAHKNAEKTAAVILEEAKRPIESKKDPIATLQDDKKSKLIVEPIAEQKIEAKPQEKKAKTKKEKFQKSKKRHRSQSYKNSLSLVEKGKTYALADAVTLLPKLTRAKFDETVELHINTLETGVSGEMTLPHGTGKTLKVVLANDEILAEVAKGKINFDVLLATPDMMPKLAKVAKVLGPRGLMPNPKNGTVTQNPEEATKRFMGGHVAFKTEAKSSIIHMRVGKLSFGEKKLSENIGTALKALPASKVKNVTLKLTMSPGIRVDMTSI